MTDTVNTAAKIAVMQAFLDGKTIEYYSRGQAQGWAKAPAPCWDWVAYDYRIKPQIVRYRRAIFHDTDTSISYAQLLSDSDERFATTWEKCSNFVRWIDKDWVEEEV